MNDSEAQEQFEDQENNNAQINEIGEDEDDGVYQDNEEGGDDELEERMQLANAQANNVYITSVDLPADDEIFKQYTREEIENFKCIFDMFDQEKSGSVDTQHLQTILKCLGRDPSESEDLLKAINPEQNKLSFSEFLLIMKNLENRLVIGQQEGAENQDATANVDGAPQVPEEATLEDRNKYGALLPRTGVHFLPDSKVVDFLK